MSWTDQNELMRLGKKMLDATGTSTPSENSMISQLASNTGVAYSVARDAYVKTALDPFLKEKVQKSMNWLINANFIPKFVDDKASNAALNESAVASTTKPDGVEIPKRMFNLDTGNLEDYPSGQYVILSHSWKGQEITYQFISKIKESQKKREAYEMVQDDSDEEARKFASFKAKKFNHLEVGKSDVKLLSAQCKQDVRAQIRKIETLLSRSGTRSNTRELLVQLTMFKIATTEEEKARNSFNEKEEELKLRKMAVKVPEDEEKVSRVGNSTMPSGMDGKNSLSKELAQANTGLIQAKDKWDQAKATLSSAEESCKVMKEDPALLSAVEDLIPILERMKSVNKIEGSIEEAKRILKLGLFPNKGPKRYLWNDTCCINKGDANELNVSLAMMGEWYNNADFCLVHLDTTESTEWVDTWDHLDKTAERPNFPSFADVKEPNWATRGWTLQELVLSKMTFHVNSLWQPLTRSVEGLGPYYYHCSYLDHHIGDSDKLDVPLKAKPILQNCAKLKELMDAEKKVRPRRLCCEYELDQRL
jgi:Heterokaryon incompatibility protein (HET)